MTPTGQAPERFGILDVGLGALRVVPDLGSIVKRAPDLLLRKPTAKQTIGLMFQRLAHRCPERPFLRFEGSEISYGDANTSVNRYAALLTKAGVQTGDVVGILAKNHPTALLAMLAVVKLGAVAGMLNHNQRGDVLAHSLGILDARVLIVDPDVAEALDSVPDTDVATITFDELIEQSADLPAIDPAVTATLPASTTAFYIFTSGTTGMPKASVMSHFRWLRSMAGIGGMAVRLRRDDTMYCSLPLYHNNALTVSLSTVLSSGACLAIGRSFSASRFFDDAVLNRATAFCYIGELCRYLLAQPEKPTDRSHSIRLMVGNGLRPEIWDEFAMRFGIERIVEFYGASEAPIAFVNVFNLGKTAGFCPLPYKIVAVDADGLPARNDKGRLTRVGTGEVGLLIAEVNDRQPFDGYTDADATEKKLLRDAFADGDVWFDTGDLVRDQGLHHIAFVDRLGDTFRWKGENVATTEVEAALDDVPGVARAVVYGVAVPGTDGRAGMAALKLVDRDAFDPAAAAAALYDALPGYAVPLFLRIVDEIAETSTFKSQKTALRTEGYADAGGDEVLVLAGRADGYVPFHDDYPADVAAARAPRN